MEEQHLTDDQSHYEISLTAGQAFVAFVLLLLSLAASFAFGLMIGKGHPEERLVVRKDTPIVTEASIAPRKDSGRIVDMGVPEDDDFAEIAKPADEPKSEPVPPAVIAEEPAPAANATETAAPADAAAPVVEEPRKPEPAAPAVPHFAQLLSTTDQKNAEALAARLIDSGFNSAYVERGSNEKGPVFRVRVKFRTESAAREAEPKLREFSKEVWITAR